MNPIIERTETLRPSEQRYTYTVEDNNETRSGYVRAYDSSQAFARVWNSIGYYTHGAIITVELVQS